MGFRRWVPVRLLHSVMMRLQCHLMPSSRWRHRLREKIWYQVTLQLFNRGLPVDIRLHLPFRALWESCLRSRQDHLCEVRLSIWNRGTTRDIIQVSHHLITVLLQTTLFLAIQVCRQRPNRAATVLLLFVLLIPWHLQSCLVLHNDNNLGTSIWVRRLDISVWSLAMGLHGRDSKI